MSFKGLIADMDLDTVDLTEDEEKSSQNTEKNRVKLENEIKTESEVIELDSSPDSQTGGETVNESQAEINWDLLEIESDKEEEKDGNLIENNNSESSQNELGLNLNFEGKEDNNNVNVLSLDSNVSTVENVDLRFILVNGEKDAKSEKIEMKGIYANEDFVSDLGENYEYEDSEGLVENNDVVSVENEKGETAEKALDFEISENKGQSELMQGEKLDLKGFYANSDIEGQNEKTGLELVLVSETEGNENENHELEKMDLDMVSNEGNENQELEKIEGQNENMDLDSEGLVENNDVIFENDKGKNPKKSLDFEISENKGQRENMLGEKLDLKRFYANSEIEGQNEKKGLEMVLVSNEGNENRESETIEVQNKKMDLELALVSNERNENRESEIIAGQNEKMDFDLDMPLVCLKKYKRKKGKSENTKDKTEQNANFSSALVLYSENENLNKRKRKKSIYLSPPFISTIKRPKMGSLFTGEDLKIVPTGEEQNNNKTKKNKFIENVLFNLNSAARNPGNPKLTESVNFKSFRYFMAKFRNSTDKGYNTIHSEPAALLLKFTTTPSKKDLIAKFTKYGVLIGTETSHENNTASVVFARKKDAESAYNALNGSGEFMNIRLRCLPAELASPPPAVLSEVREKVAGIVERLNGSGLDLEMDLVGDAKGLLAKVNYVMSKDCCVNNNKAIINV